MTADPAEGAWLSEHTRVSLQELEALSGLPRATLLELVDCGALSPTGEEGADWTFSARCVITLRSAGRLGSAFDLDANALALTLSFLERIAELEAQVQGLRAQMPRRVP